MTLLETAVATVLLAVAAVTCLESTREALAASRRAVAWHHAVAQADAALADAALADAALPGSGPGVADSGVRLSRRPYAPGVVLVEAAVRLPEGGEHRVARLLPAGPP